jgi:DNA-binding MarR family transcriptional regulator
MDIHELSPDLHCCLDCTAFNLRKATRAVSQFYDALLRPTGIRGTQFSLLVALKLKGNVLITELAEKTIMDRTTLTRNLEVMEKQGLVDVSPGDDRRTRVVSITEQGLAILLKAYPLWLQAQTQIANAMQNERMDQLMAGINELIKITKQP